MKPVFQTKRGMGGNCLAACLASLFEIELDEMPDLAPPECFEDWTVQSRLRSEWLAGRGFSIFTFDVTVESHVWVSGSIPFGPHLFGVKSPNPELAAKGYGHFVLGTVEERDGKPCLKVVHDPLGELAGPYHVEQVCFLVPLKPHLQCRY